MRDLDTIARLEPLLDAIMLDDAAWCRRQLTALRGRLRRGQAVDSELQQVIDRVQNSAARLQARVDAMPTPQYDPALPITALREDLVAAIRAHPVVIVAGETGSGKTTQLPKFCLEAGRGRGGLVGCTQPRRIAARAMAARVAEELGVPLGTAVGYQVRFREQLSPDGYLKFMTDGILLAEAVHDRRLMAYDTLIIDEAHERSLNIDFLLGYLHQLLPRRPDLKLIITSATIDTAKFAAHFGGAPVITVSGRGYPVDILYRPLGEEPGEEEAPDSREQARAIVTAVNELGRIDRRGDMLVFLSGEREIHEARDALQRARLPHTEVLPLYARLSAAEQQRVFHPGPQRRIILSTNVAETSLTVPRIRFVIDTGLARISRYAHRSRIQRLPIEPISQASANQRAGRCGRLGPGTCIRLYAEADLAGRPEFTEPEILRTSLASVILRMLTMGLGAVEDFPFLDPPAPRMINDAQALLVELGAVDAAREPTPVGRRMAEWPLDVRLARMIHEGQRLGCLEDTLVLAAALSIQDPRERPLEARQAADEAHARFADERSDFVSLLRLWEHLRSQRRQLTGSQFRKLCQREYLAMQRVLEWFDLYQQLRDQAREERLPLTGQHGDFEALHKALLSGLLSQVGRRHPEERSYLGARNRSFHIFPGSGLFGRAPPWIMAAEVVETSKPWARTCAQVEPAWIEQQGAHLIKRSHFDPHWSRKRGRVMAWEQVSLYGLVLTERRRVAFEKVDPAGAREIFIREALVRGELDTRAGFAAHNQRLREEVERLEHKRRQRDVLVDEAVLQEFFDARLPPGVNSAKSLERWLESLGEAGRERLHLAVDVLLREDAGQAPQERFPDTLLAGGQALALDYLFAPGDPADGVTVRVPLEALNLLDPGQAQWLVPGLLRDKVVELMRGLPKPLRRALTPLPQFADAALEALASRRDQPLLEALAASLAGLTRVAITPADFDEGALPEHLRLRIVVIDAQGGVLAQGRDLQALQQRFGAQARRSFMDRQGAGFSRDGVTTWDFGALPMHLRTDAGARAWPALVDQQDSVALRLFDTREEAAWSHLEGVRRLLALQLGDKLERLRRSHGLSARAAVAWSAWGSLADLVQDLAWSSLCAVTGEGAAAVRGATAFEALLAQARRMLGPEFKDRAILLSGVLEQASALSRDIDALPASRAAVRDGLRAQLDDLVYDGFLADLDPARLRHVPRYLEAMRLRLERLALDPGRDARLLQRVLPYWSRYQQRIAAGHAYTPALDAFRWLLEEYRVSLFAQALGTDGKVSAKRLDEAWQRVLGERG